MMTSALAIALLLQAAVTTPVQESDVRQEITEVMREDFAYAPNLGSPTHVNAVLDAAYQELPAMLIVSQYNYFDLKSAIALKAIQEPSNLGYVFHTRQRGLHGGELTAGIWPEIERRYLEATNGFTREVKLTVFKFEW